MLNALSASENKKQYAAKLLLFGEHSVQLKGDALAVPLNILSGRWKKNEPLLINKITIDEHLLAFSEFISAQAKECYLPFDTQKFLDDVKMGWFFDSDIAQGYGVGSSGAVTAAVFDTYKTEKIENVNVLKKVLALLESYFHGTSSGIDPLVIYTNKAVQIKKGELTLLTDFVTPLPVFIIDTHIPRSAKKYIDIFLEKNKNPDFNHFIRSNYMPCVERAIQNWLLNDAEKVWAVLADISVHQFIELRELIPESFLNFWLSGLKSDAFKLKLCGAGGGGYILCFGRNAAQTENILTNNGFSFKRAF